MHSVSPAFIRSSSAIRSSMRVVQRRTASPSRHAPACGYGEPRELRPNLVQRQPDLLREDDEGHSAQDEARVPPVPGIGPFRRDQAPCS